MKKNVMVGGDFAGINLAKSIFLLFSFFVKKVLMIFLISVNQMTDCVTITKKSKLANFKIL